MTEFELLSVPVGLVLGLGMTKILGSVTSIIRNRNHIKLHWLPFTWALVFILFLLVFFFHIWDINLRYQEESTSWTWPHYGPVILHIVLMYLGCGLILPSEKTTNQLSDLLVDFEAHGKLALILLAITLMISWPFNMYLHAMPFFVPGNYLNLILTILIIAFLKFNNRSFRNIITILFLVIQIYGMLFHWSRPGHFEYVNQDEAIEELKAAGK